MQNSKLNDQKQEDVSDDSAFVATSAKQASYGEPKEKVEEVENVDSAEQKVKKEDKETEKLKQKVLDLENQIKRVLADYQNLQKRVLEERREIIRSANKDLLLRVLPVLDTIMMVQKHAKDKNIEVSVQQFLQVLKNEGVERIETKGKEFDPITMECVTTEEGEEGKVLEELRAGYKLDDKVLRPAQVIVGRTSN